MKSERWIDQLVASAGQRKKSEFPREMEPMISRTPGELNSLSTKQQELMEKNGHLTEFTL